MSTEQVESLWSGLFDNSGQPLSGGKVHTYLAGTSTPANLYSTQDKTLSAGNPIVLDSYGRALAYGEGSYKFVVDDATDVTQYTMDNLTYGTALSGGTGGATHWGGPSAGSGNSFTMNPFPAITSYIQGDRFTFLATQTNTGPVTLSVNGLAAVPIRRGPAASVLTAGDIQAGNIVDVIYDATAGGRFLPTNGTDFLLHLNPSNQGLLSPGVVLTQAGGFYMTPGSNDGEDVGDQIFGYTAASRGAALVLCGNERAGIPGRALISAGDVASSAVELRTVGTQTIQFTTSNTPRWLVQPAGQISPYLSNTYDIGEPSLKVRDIYLEGDIYLDGDILKANSGWAPSMAASGAMTVSGIGISQSDYCRLGPFVFFRLSIGFTLGGTMSNTLYITLPPIPATSPDGTAAAFGCTVDDGDGTPVANGGGRWRVISATQFIVFKPGVANFVAGSSAMLNMQSFYRAA